MSELEPSTETARPESPNIPAPGDNSNSNSAPDTPTAAITLPPVQNGVDSSPATAQPVASSIKRFSSANITKKFLQKAGPSLNTSASPPAVSSTSPSPVPTKTAPSLGQSLIYLLFCIEFSHIWTIFIVYFIYLDYITIEIRMFI